MSDPVNDPVPPESTLIKDPVFAWGDRDMARSFLYGVLAGVGGVLVVLYHGSK